MKLIFAGTPEFAAVALAALLEAGHEISLVLTQPDRPAGRGMHARESRVKTLAQERALPIAQPASLKTAESQALLQAQAADAMVVAAYGLILPPAVLEIPRARLSEYSCVIAAALARRRADPARAARRRSRDRHYHHANECRPRHRGYSAAGDDADHGATTTRRPCTTGSHRWAAVASCAPCTNSRAPVAQDDARATYAAKITKAEAAIDWSLGAEEICRRVRAYNPVPGAMTTLEAAALKIWRAQPVAHARAQPPARY